MARLYSDHYYSGFFDSSISSGMATQFSSEIVSGISGGCSGEETDECNLSRRLKMKVKPEAEFNRTRDDIPRFPRYCILPHSNAIMVVWRAQEIDELAEFEIISLSDFSRTRIQIPSVDSRVYSIAVDENEEFIGMGYSAGKWKAEVRKLDNFSLVGEVEHSHLVEKLAFCGKNFFSISDKIIVLQLDNGKSDSIKIGDFPRHVFTCHPGKQYMLAQSKRNCLVVVDAVDMTVVKKLYFGGLRDCLNKGNGDWLDKMRNVLARETWENLRLAVDSNRVAGRYSANSIAFCEDGRQVYIACADGVFVYDWELFMQAEEVTPEPLEVIRPNQIFAGKDYHASLNDIQKPSVHVTEVCPVGNGNLVFVTLDGKFHLYLEELKKVKTLANLPPKMTLNTIRMSPDGKKLILICYWYKFGAGRRYGVESSLIVWDLAKLIS
jgi:hypothetical protein